MMDGMAAEDALVIERGTRPRILVRPSYLDDPDLAGLAKANPFYRGRKLVRKARVQNPRPGSNVIAFPKARSR